MDVKIEEFINFINSRKIVEEYSLKVILFSKYALSLVSNPRNEMSSFLVGISDIVKEASRTTILHGDTPSRFMVYTQSIEESKLWRRSRDSKRGRTEEQVQPKLKKRVRNNDDSNAPKGNYERGGVSQIVKPTFATRGKKHFGKCLPITSGFFECGKDDHKVTICPTIALENERLRKVLLIFQKVVL